MAVKKTNKKDAKKTASPQYFKKTFENIPADKQNRILNVAIIEFASKGFNAANVNVIAENAGISIGSMYTYFPSKEDLFLMIIDSGYKKIVEAFETVPITGTTIQKFETIFRLAQEQAHKNQKLNQIYLDITSESLSLLSRKLSRKLETITSKLYKQILIEGKQNGEVDPSLDENLTSFFIDNLVMFLQFSYTSEYYKERMKIFVGAKIFKDDEAIIKGVMTFVKRAIIPPVK